MIKNNPSLTTIKAILHLVRSPLFLWGILCLLMSPGLARAAVIHVDTNVQCGGGTAPEPVQCDKFPAGSDSDGTTGCSLGEAIVAANTDADFGGCITGTNVDGPYDPIGDTIVLDAAGPYDFTQVDNTSPEGGPNALPVIDSLIFIDAKGNTLEGVAGSCSGFKGRVGKVGLTDGGFTTGDQFPPSDFLMTCDFFRTFQVNGLLSVNNATIQKFDPGCDKDYCGDGLIQRSSGEQCDDGASNGTDGDPCSKDCKFSGLQLLNCGDGVVASSEECDDGGKCASDNSACTSNSTCAGTGTGTCVSNVCTGDPSVSCSVDADCEICTPRSGDGCDSNCKIEAGYSCEDDGSSPSVCSSGCGDGSVNGVEECDNGGLWVGCTDATPNGTHCTTSDTPCAGGKCVPQDCDGCNSHCRLENHDRCYSGGAISSGSSGFDDSKSGGTCSSGKSGGSPSILEIHTSTLKNNATMTNDPFLTGFPGTKGMSPGLGGAVFVGLLGTTHITDTTFTGNVSTVGGAIAALANQIDVQKSTFNGNKTVMDANSIQNQGTGLSGVGGAIAAAISDVKVNKSSFWDNHAGNLSNFVGRCSNTGNSCTSDGDCTDTCGDGTCNNSSKTCSIDADCNGTCDKDPNFGQFGGAIISLCSPFQLNNSSVFQNDAQLGGGIMSVYSFTDCSLFFGDGAIKLGTCTGSTEDICVGGPDDGMTCNPLHENSCGIQSQGGKCTDPNGQGCADNSTCGNGICSPNQDSNSLLLVDRLNNSKMTIANSTITKNTASEEGGGYHSILDDPSRILLEGSILGGNTLSAGGSTSGPDCQGALTSSDNNLIGSLEGCTFPTKSGDIVPKDTDTTIDPKLANCNDNTTTPPSITNTADPNYPGHQICPPLATSPVLNRGPVKPNGPSDDQVGTLRYPGTDTHSDIGAMELNQAICGDGIVEAPTESCDNGGVCAGSSTTSLNGTTCTADFQCGDGTCAPQEGNGCSASCALETCGNGILDPGEQCDEGMKCDDGTACKLPTDCAGHGATTACAPRNSSTCTTACMSYTCGNGVLDPGEQCDGSLPTLPNGAVCSSTCIIVPAGGGSSAPVCGNGVKEAGEQCDDGNFVNGDGCDNNCTISACGNHIVAGTEQCDDGNTVSGDGCSSTCQLEYCGDSTVQATLGEQCDPPNGTTCDGFCHTVTPGEPFCGDGIVNGNEQCDDGINNQYYNKCLPNCTKATCGDGFLELGVEQCDDGASNGTVGDGCSGTCKIVVTTPPRCGDGHVDPGEQCDDGNTVNTDGCTNNCTLPACGDGILQAGEDCDPPNGTTCSASCKAIQVTTGGGFCGDGIIQGGEECDNGDANHGGGNSNTADNCRTNCKLPHCGDGIKDSNEQCDDGNTDPYDDCTNLCLWNVCGDGVIHKTTSVEILKTAEVLISGPGPIEQCDDGNNLNDDSCKNDCTPAVCGDGIIAFEGGETCDDGKLNGTPGDPCSANCQEIPPSGPVCGNGIVEDGEECDDGNGVNTDACTNACKKAVCGDGIVETGVEQCDDGAGNGASGDTCSATCQTVTTPPKTEPSCGDGQCNNGETPDTCPQDCPDTCGDNLCTGNETNATCPGDCSLKTNIQGQVDCSPVTAYVTTIPESTKPNILREKVNTQFGQVEVNGVSMDAFDACLTVFGGTSPNGCSLNPAAPNQTPSSTTTAGLEIWFLLMIPAASLATLRRKARGSGRRK